jgi:hypothetical protein
MDKQSIMPSFDVAFLKEVREKINDAAQGLVDYDFLSQLNETIKTVSIAAPQAEGWAVGDKAMNNTLHDHESLKAAPQAAGPVWVRHSQRFPEDWVSVINRNRHTKQVINEFDVEKVEDEFFLMEGGKTIAYSDCEWLDEH